METIDIKKRTDVSKVGKIQYLTEKAILEVTEINIFHQQYCLT